MTTHTTEKSDLRQIGRDLLGPIINLYLLRLHAHLLQTDPQRDCILFGLRAGLRIRSLYGAWLEKRGSSPPGNTKLLKISRLMAIKAAFKNVPDLALTALAGELDGESLDTIVRALLRAEVPSKELRRDIPPIPPQPLHEFLRKNIPTARQVRRHLNGQAELFQEYLNAITGDAERLVLVDTGWRGTQQLLLEQTFPKKEWTGLYFGCIGRASILGVQPRNISGLMFDSQVIDPDNPISTLVLHRHLIENLFEPFLPSVESIDRRDVDAARHGEEARSTESELRDQAYEGVAEHIWAHASDTPRAISAAYAIAMTRLPGMISAPTPPDVEHLTLKPRSLDLGRTGSVSVVLPSKNRDPGDSPEQRVKDALWGPGQATIEFEGPRRHRAHQALQARVTRPAQTDEPSIAIITRTKDRPILLARAARSVAAQTYQNICWVVVNDGGDPEPVRDVLDRALVDPSRILFLSHDESLGMEAASNAGIRASTSDLIVIHDDDDSWEPDFLEQSVTFLQRHKPLYDGVVCHSVHIEEVVSGNMVLECGRRPFNNWLQNVQIAEMAASNMFPPISFLFRRSVWHRLGGFDETLPVLGDWDFNLRFLMETDIGVLPMPLANYHHRSDEGEDTDGSYANSDSGSENPHVAFNAILRNRYLRRAAHEPQLSTLASLMGQAYGLGDLRSRLETTPVGAFGKREDTEADRLKSRCVVQQRELDRRWVLLQMTVTEIIRTRGLSIEAGELIRQIAGLADQYVQSTVIQSPPDFDETAYRMQNPDIARAIAEGRFKSAFDHFTKFGRHQGRQRPHAEPAGQQWMPADD